MGQSFAVFLRGVNVNNTRMKMAILREAFVSMDYLDVKTLLASGNVVVTSDDATMTLMDHKMKIEMGLSLYFGYEAYVIVKSRQELKAIVEEASGHVVPDGHHHYLMLSNDEDLGHALRQVFDEGVSGPKELLLTEAHGIYWIVAKGNTLESDFGTKALGKEGFRDKLTSRTMNTVVKVHKALEARYQ